MRRMTLTLLIFALAGCGGTWSNKDLEFLKVLPDRSQLAAKLPQTGSTTQGLTGTHRDGLNLGEPSQVYADTRKAATDFNALLQFILAIPETARKLPPSQRTADARVWGPFADKSNPGLEVRLTIRQVDDLHFNWALEARQNGSGYQPTGRVDLRPAHR